MVDLARKSLLGLVVLSSLFFSYGCTVSIEGLGDLADYLPLIVTTDCGDDCGYDVIEIEHDD
jgi:hypothetical protein